MKMRMLLAALMIAIVPFSLIAEDKEPAVVSVLPGDAPSDAVVLFDGTDLSQWTYLDGRPPAGWVVKGGEVTVREESAITKEQFGDMQIHLEFCTPVPGDPEDRGHGNSGIYIHRNYEIQIINSYQNPTPSSGMCGAVYKQTVPLVNACRPQGIWQEYNIVFRAPRFDTHGNKTKNAIVTVILNGIIIQDHVEILGPTGAAKGNKEIAEGPILLQEHGSPVRFRNVWVRKLKDGQ